MIFSDLQKVPISSYYYYYYSYYFLKLGYSKIESIFYVKTYLGILNASLARSVISQKFRFLTRLWTTDKTFAISGSQRSRSHKNAMRYSLLGYVSRAKVYPDMLNISLGISIAHQAINISKFSFAYGFI